VYPHLLRHSDAIERLRQDQKPQGAPGPPGPRQSRRRRCKVRRWLELNCPGWCSSNHSGIVVASSAPSRSRRSRGSTSSSQTSMKGSGRVRQRRGSGCSDGIGPRCQERALRVLIPAAAAAAS
jgi:hypothetical protein